MKGSFSTPPLVNWGIRAWGLVNGSGTAHFDASNNFSSMTDHGSGSYSFYFSTNMPDTSYVVTGSTGRNATPHFSLQSNSRATNYFTVSTGTWGSSFTAVNNDSIMFIVNK